jgi:osmoprotectant transport system substrate-binding protein
MRFKRAVAVGLVALTAVAFTACGDDDDTKESTGTTAGADKPAITIGAFNFSESAILAHIYAGALQAEGYKVTVRENLGNREVVAPALEKGEIDLYPGYAATELEYFNSAAGEATPDVDANVQKLRERLAAKQLTALAPSEAIDQNAFAVTKETAEKYKLEKMSDLAPIAGQLVLGGPPECATRPFCGKGLSEKYGINFKEIKSLDPGGPLSKAALKNGDVQVALVFSSDGAISANGWKVLEDDKRLQNADNVTPIVRTSVATVEVTEILNKVSKAITTEDLTGLNKRADLDKEDPDALAKDWLDSHDVS